MRLKYFRGDELPAWEASITLNGGVEDFTVGWGFSVTLTDSGGTEATVNPDFAPALGSVQVRWAVGDLDIDPGTWTAELTGTRDDDDRQFTISDTVLIRPRALAE